MAIQISGTTVVNDSRQLQNIASVDATTAAVIAANAGGVTLLGTLTPSNGATSISLSSLSLSSYKLLHIMGSGLALNAGNNSNFYLQQNGSRGKWVVSIISSKLNGGRTLVDLSTGYGYTSSTSGLNDTTFTEYTYSSGGAGARNYGITTSTTTITIYASSGSFYGQGNIKFYGVK